MASGATQNSCPKPFNLKEMHLQEHMNDHYHQRHQDLFHQNMNTMNSMSVPRIIVNNNNNQNINEPIEPTSTVYKSLAGSRQFGQHQMPAVARTYSRLISPTISQGSMSSISPATHYTSTASTNEYVQSSCTSSQNINNNQGRAWSQHATPTTSDGYQSGSGIKYQLNEPVESVNRVQTSVSSPSECKRQPIEMVASTSHQSANSRSTSAQGDQQDHDYKHFLDRISPNNNNSPTTLSRNVLVPDDKRNEFMRDKQLEQMSIAYQTYRTLPIVSPKPKARHDLASGTYMHMNQDPSWDLLERSSKSRGDLEQNVAKFQQAIRSLDQIDNKAQVTRNLLINSDSMKQLPTSISRSSNTNKASIHDQSNDVSIMNN